MGTLWTEGMSVGIQSLDEDHKFLLDLICSVAKVAEHPGQVGLIAAVDRFITALQLHYQREEEMLRRSHFPGLSGHQANHRETLAELLAMRERIARTAVGGRDASALLMSGFIRGLHTMDMDYKWYFLDHCVIPATLPPLGDMLAAIA